MISIWIWIVKLCRIIKNRYKIKDGLDKNDLQLSYLLLFYLVFIKPILKVPTLLLLRQVIRKTIIEKLNIKSNQIFTKTNRLRIYVKMNKNMEGHLYKEKAISQQPKVLMVWEINLQIKVKYHDNKFRIIQEQA
jgi:hypothetical protein